MSDMECSSYYLEPVCEDTAVCDMAGSDSSRSFAESANLINDCQNNLVEDIMSEVSGLEETEVVAPDFEEMEEMSINSEDRADFAQGAALSEASSDLFSRIENFHFQHSEHLARIKAAGRAVTGTYIACESVEVFKEEENLEVEKLVPDSDESEASSDFFTPSQLAKIKAVNDAYMAFKPVEVFKEEEKLEVEELESDVVLTQGVPESEASSFLFTPLQLARIKAVNDAYRARNEEKEKEAFQAMILADLSITQYSGYGAFNANHLIPRVIEGLEPKVHCNQLIRNWLLNEKNLFEITFY